MSSPRTAQKLAECGDCGYEWLTYQPFHSDGEWRCGSCGSDRLIDVRSKGKSVVYLNRRDNAVLTEEDIERAINVLQPGVGVPHVFTDAFKGE